MAVHARFRRDSFPHGALLERSCCKSGRMGAGPRRVGRAPRPPFPTMPRSALCACPPIRRATHSSNPLGRANSLSHLNPPPTCAFPVFGFSLLLRTHQDSTGPNALFALFPSLYLALCAAFFSPSLSLKVSFNSHRRPVLYQPALPFCSAFCCSRCLRITPRRLPGPRFLVLGPRPSTERPSSPVLNSRARRLVRSPTAPRSSHQQRRRRDLSAGRVPPILSCFADLDLTEQRLCLLPGTPGTSEFPFRFRLAAPPLCSVAFAPCLVVCCTGCQLRPCEVVPLPVGCWCRAERDNLDCAPRRRLRSPCPTTRRSTSPCDTSPPRPSDPRACPRVLPLHPRPTSLDTDPSVHGPSSPRPPPFATLRPSLHAARTPWGKDTETVGEAERQRCP